MDLNDQNDHPVANVQALLLSDNNLIKESDDDHQSPSPQRKKPESSHAKESTEASDSKSSSCSKVVEDHLAKHEEVAASYADSKSEIKGWLNVEMIFTSLKEIREAVKEDPVLNKKVTEAIEAYTKNSINHIKLLSLSSTSMAWSLSPIMTNIRLTQAAIQSNVTSLKKDTSDIKSMGENFAHTATEEPPSYTKGEKANIDTKEMVVKESVKELEAEKELSRPHPSDTIPSQPESPPVAPKADRGKWIATNDTEEPTKKLVPASRKVHHDHDALILLLKKAAKEAKLLEMSKPDLIKVVQEEATKAGVDPKILKSAKGGQQFKKIQDAELKPEPITDVKIHPNTKPAEINVNKSTDKRNFKVYNPFKFGNFGINELDELGRKRKKMELEPEIRILALECNINLPNDIPFVNNMVIEEPEYGIFFIDVFGDEAFQRISNINKVGFETLWTYLVTASNITTLENTRFCLKLRKLIEDHPNQEKLKSKKVKLESMGYKLN
ncbi:hypothetical protein Tco_1298401 [Tanacetum coccineum]